MKGRPTWLKWVGLALAGYLIFGRTGSRQRNEPSEAPSPSPAAVTALDEDEVSAAADARLKAEVEKVLEDSPRTSDEAIAVHVDEGDVTLTGHVHEREVAQEADRLARTVGGVTDVSNEIELRAPGDHRSSVPRAEAVPAVPEAAGLPALDSALRMATRDIPVAALLRAGRRDLERGRPEAALEAFTAVLSLDPGNREAAEGARDAGREIQKKAERLRRNLPQPPSAPPPPEGR
jgi:hypothetical protein